MRINTDSFVIGIFLFFCGSNIGWIDPLSERIEQGNRLYDQKKYAEAQQKYQDAQTLDPELMELYYNLADALYKQQKFDDAEGLYNKVVNGADKKLKADALHNLGNIKVKKKELEQALKYYRKSIRLNPSDQDTRMNYEQALQMLQQQQQQQQQDQKNKDKNQDNKQNQQDQQNQKNQDDQKKQDQKNQEKQDQKQSEKDNQDSQQDQQQQNGKNDQESQQQQDQKQKEGDSQEQQQPQQDKQPLTEEQLKQLQEKLKPDQKIEANPYLRALEKQEFENRRKQVYGDSKLYIEKDW